MYLRLHGDSELYVSGYTDEALERWAARIRAWTNGSEPPDAKRISPTSAPRRRVARHLLLFRQRRESPRAARCAYADA